MFLCYLDASGTPSLRDSTLHYALVGAAVHEHAWFALNERIAGLKRRYAFPGEDFELHVMDFNTVIDEQGQIPDFESLGPADRRANVQRLRLARLAAATGAKRMRLDREFRRTRPFVHLTRADRSRLYEDALDLIGGHNGLVLFGEAIEKRHPSVVDGSVDCVRQAFEQVITRFDDHLSRKAKWRQLFRSKPARGDNGLIVMDRDQEREGEIERRFADYREHGHAWGRLRHVIDAPFFVASAKFPGVQAVDVCAFALRRYLDKGATAGGPEERQFLRIFHLFDRDAGRLHGLRHFAAADACGCVICREPRGDDRHRPPEENPANRTI